MEFQTQVDIKPFPKKINHDDHLLLLGSCFSDNIGAHLLHAGFHADVNPLGTLYNPVSILEALHPTNWREFSKWLHARATFITDSNGSTSSDLLPNPIVDNQYSNTIITFGTAWVWRLKETGMIVANCRKQPANLFIRERLTITDIVDTWTAYLNALTHNSNSDLPVIIFTVSPLRYRIDGYHENQLSKSILFLAIDELCRRFPHICTYFPAYEIMMDQLRDYRFYADDIHHSSSLAIEYIWQRFQETYFTIETRTQVKKYEKLYKQTQHVSHK